MSRKLTTKEFIDKSRVIHGDIYDYSKVDYVGGRGKIDIVCPKHGVFTQRASAHKSGQGCPICNTMNRRCVLSEVLKEAKSIHNDKYDYSLIREYKTSNTKIPIICPKHGKFTITSHHHINRGQGCGECKSLGLNGFLDKANEKHGDTYDYTLVDYVNNKTKVTIICPTHGEFKQRPSDHMFGCGCPICNESLGEKSIRLFLEQNNIMFIPQHRFGDCKNIKPLPFDFYLPEHNVCVEFNGKQHYEIVNHFGGSVKFIQRKINDDIKREYCVNNNIHLIIIKYDEPIEAILTNLI
jgi:hypothetical protein